MLVRCCEGVFNQEVYKGIKTMKKLVSVVLLGGLLSFANAVGAGELVFAESADDIMKALQFKNVETVYEGVKYGTTKSGAKFQERNGRRYRMRGLGKIVDSSIVPKVGISILFETNAASVHPKSAAILDQLGIAFQKLGEKAQFRIAGHTDSQGSDSYNMTLSENRAKEVGRFLVRNYGISKDRLKFVGFGEDRPIKSNGTAAGRAKNRRVEIARLK